MNIKHLSFAALLLGGTALIIHSSCNQPPSNPVAAEVKKEPTSIEHGKFLVTIGGCNDCHSPKVMTDHGPVPDETKLLSGHPENSVLPSINWNEAAPGKWYLLSSDMTAAVGPWGVSFAYNLTPDSATGIGAWTPDLFIQIMRTGMHMGMQNGRPVLPPMPWQNLSQLSDQDLTDMFAYLKSLPAVSNKVPEPLPPNHSNVKG